MINRQLSRLLLCSILGNTTLISGCAWYVRILHLINSSNRNKSNWPTIFILPAPATQAQWWKQLNDPQLDALIQRTLSGSHTLAEAKLREEKRSPVPIC